MTPRFQDRPVRAVLFDYGLTLMTYARPRQALDRAYRELAILLSQRVGCPAPRGATVLREVHDAVAALIAANEADGSLREVDINAAYRTAFAGAGLDDLDPVVLDEVLRREQEAWWEGIRIAPGVPETLGALRRRGLRVGLCSNAPYRPQSMRAQLDHFGLTPLFDGLAFSGEVGWRKPDARLFHGALSQLDCAPQDTVMVGDRVREDIAGAHAYGMRAIRIREHADDTDSSDRAEAVIDRVDALLELFIE